MAKTKTLNVHFIDAFTDQIFHGNTAGVIISEEWLPAETMQAIAIENNLSETAFLVAEDPATYHIRWFSPITEIDFCGHATLASAHVIFSQQPQLPSIRLTAAAVGDMSITRLTDGRIAMDFPNRKPQRLDTIPEPLKNGLTTAPQEIWQSNQAYFAVYDNEQDILTACPNLTQLTLLAPYDVVITAPAKQAQVDFVSRYFWPANGGDEDPVTGSIHTGLAPLWAEKLDKTKLTAYQASKRGGTLYCEVKGDRVEISGHATPYLSGVIALPLLG